MKHSLELNPMINNNNETNILVPTDHFANKIQKNILRLVLIQIQCSG